MNRSVVAAAVLLSLAVTTTACRTASGAEGEPDRVRIMVGGLDKVIYLPAMLTEQLGFFDAAGVDVQLLTEPSGAQAETVLLAGDVHGVVGFYDHTVDLQAKGKCIQSVVQFAHVPGEAIVVASDKADEFASPESFAGKRMGVTSPGSSTDFLTRALAARAGLPDGAYSTVKAGAGQTFIAAIENGGIDAGMTTDPTIARLTTSGKGEVLIDLRTEEGTRATLGGLYPGASLYMECGFVERNRPTVQRLANAFVSTQHWIATHSAEETAAAMPRDFAGGDPDLYVKAIADSKAMFTADGVMPETGPETVLEVLASFSPNVKGKQDEIDLSKTYTTEFVTAAELLSP